MDAIYRVEGNRAITGPNAAGPWDPRMQHGSAPAALVVWAAEAIPTSQPMQIARVTGRENSGRTLHSLRSSPASISHFHFCPGYVTRSPVIRLRSLSSSLSITCRTSAAISIFIPTRFQET